MGRVRHSGTRDPAAVKVGLFGQLGGGNIGNDASMEAILNYLRTEHPAAVLGALCTGPETVASEYGIAATPVLWYRDRHEGRSSVTAIPLKLFGKVVDTFRTVSWVRRHDVVIVPGMGILEASLPLRASGTPYYLFVVSAAGRIFGTKVALVSVGAAAINQRMTRWLFNGAARLAFYRSYRDEGAREAMRLRGIDTSHDHVYPDLAFALPGPAYDPGDPQMVGVGLMAYYGTNDDRSAAAELHSAYVATMKSFVRWLVDNDRVVRLFVGDTNGSDDQVVDEVLADIRNYRPELPASRVVAESVSKFSDVTRAMQPLGTVVAIRFHNVLCALKLSKPTLALGYSSKHDSLMDYMGVSEFCQPARSANADELIVKFKELEGRAHELAQSLLERNAATAPPLHDLF
jgi:polysaccharide pyruvyl transferase WcaK-like protein